MKIKLRIRELIKKISLFDYLIILMLVVGLFAFYRFLQQDKKNLEVSIIANVTAFQLDSLRAGDFETDTFGNKIAVIKSVEGNYIPNSDSPFFDKVATIELNLQVDTNKQGNVFKYKNQPLQVGSQVIFDFNSTSIYAMVSKINGKSQENEYVKKILTIKVYNMYPWLADSIQTDSETEPSKQEKIRVISKQTNPTEAVRVDTQLNHYPQNVDLTLEVEAELQKYGDSYLFQGYNSVYKGKSISFVVGDTEIKDGLITNIK